VRLAILTAGTLLVGLVVGFVAGVAIGGQQTASAPPETVTVERTVEAQEEQQASATGSASASASVAPEQADKDCQVGQECDLGSASVLIESAERTDALTPDYASPMSGDFMVVSFAYTWKGDSPVSLGEIPWVLTDGDGTQYTYDFDATNNYAVDQNRSTVYEEVQPGVTKPGMAIFSVAPEAKGFTLTITDLANPQAGQSANVEL
jgi:hypothetical protein